MAENGSILVTGAAGQLGAVGRTVTGLLLDRGLPVRAMVRREDDRVAALRAAGAEVVVGDLLEPADVSRVVAAVLADPGPHLGRIYELTGPRSQDMHAVAREFSDALHREVTYADISPEEWEQELIRAGLPEHLTGHLVTMGAWHR